jgi:hypothetical protein
VTIASVVMLTLSAALAVAAPIQTTSAADLHGRVVFNDLGVPGATVTATARERVVITTSDESGDFHFTNLDPGAWLVRIEMRGFTTVTRPVTLPYSGAPLIAALTLRPFAEIAGSVAREPVREAVLPLAANLPEEDLPEIVTGSSINGAASPFAQPRAFGNNRPKRPSLYNGAITALTGNSTWNARPYSFSGAAAPEPSYSDLQLGAAMGGPLRIPWVLKYGPQTFASFQHGVTHSAETRSALMPIAAERRGDFTQRASPIRDPLTGAAFPDNVIPADRIVPQARSLLRYYPLPNVADANGTSGANYQAPVVTATTQDTLQVAMNGSIARRDALAATLAFQHTSADSAGLFGFLDTNRQSSLTANASWNRRVSPRLSWRVRYQFTRAATNVDPFFANRINVSAEAGITGNEQSPENWGPPTLAFPDLAGLTDANHQQTVKMAHGGGGDVSIRRGLHTVTVGGDLRRNRFDMHSQPDPRGTLTFTGAFTGQAFADFLIGLPAASALAYSDASTRLRGAAYDAYFSDDWRATATLTLNLGVRWEYESPYTEAGDRLVNLGVAPGFAAITPVTASDANRSLIAPDRRGIQPRLSASWRPSLGSSLVVRAGYGIYRNLGVYDSIALLLAQQPPFSRTFSIQNSVTTPLTLANPFPASVPGTTNTFGLDPGFRSALAHAWQVSAQRELPGSMTVTAAYLGTAGRRLMQAFLPNTYPAGAIDPCPACPSGFAYVTSTGDSIRHAAQFTLRRRLHNGLTATAQYTRSRSLDDAATFSNRGITVQSLSIAQDWLNLEAERGPSSFDQPHLLSVQVQYTTGMGIAGGTLQEGRRAALFKDWTIAAQLSTGSGLPFTPIAFTSVAGTGVVGVRPSLTGASTESPASGIYGNPAAYATAAPGQWGDAGRNSIRGPAQFALDASVTRAIPLPGRFGLEWRLSATNLLNRVTFATIDTIVSSPQFGLPTRANPMRALQMSLRVRF